MNENNIDTIVIGAGLTGLTLAYYLKKAGKNVVVLERTDKPGGVIHTITQNGFTYETGPNTGIIGSPELVELIDDLGKNIEVEIADPKAKYRWIWKNGKWNALPSGFISAVTTPLFSLKDKIRILGEPFRKPGKNPNETVKELVIRRLGKSFLNYAVDPFISGIYAGDPSKLVTRFALPKLYNLEQNYGSFIKGAIKKAKEPKAEIEKRVSREVFSTKGGLYNLILALEKEIGKENIIYNALNLSVNKSNNAYSASFTQNDKDKLIESDKIISTVNGFNVKSIFSFLQEEDVKPFQELNYAKVVQVVACYNEWKGIPINAFGGLIPSIEEREALGILFPSSIFKNRAPEKGAILSIFLGGINKPGMHAQSEFAIEKIALKEIKETLKTEEYPDLIKIFKYERAIPQYEITSGERFETIKKLENQYPGLIIAGNVRDGIGIADRVKQAKQIAYQIIN